MKINQEADNKISMTLDREELIHLKTFIDKYTSSLFSYTTTTSVGNIITTSTGTGTLWPGIKSWYSNMYNDFYEEPTKNLVNETIEKLKRALDLIFQKDTKNNE